MTEQPKTVVCGSCNAKFHVPDELIRGKLVKFRCRKCGSAMDVDGRRSARIPAAPVALPPPPPPAETAPLDTPATFSQRTLPPPARPPVGLTKSSPNLHPWPEPPRTRSTIPPTAVSDSIAPGESMPPVDTVRDPSNRGPKIAAIVALLIAAGLSGFGLAMRNAPGGAANASAEEAPGGEATESRNGRTRTGEQAKLDESNRTHRTPTRVTDLPPAADGVEPAATAGAAAAKPSEAPPEKQEFHAAVNAPGAAAPNGAVPAATNVAPTTNMAAGANAAEPGGPSHEPVAEPGTGSVAAGTNGAAAPQAASPAPVAPSPSPSRAKGDFNTQAAREAMEDAAGRARKCRTIDTPAGTARVAVTFAPNGQVTNAVIDSGPIVGTAAGNCVASKFRSAKVPPFSGESVTVRKSVTF